MLSSEIQSASAALVAGGSLDQGLVVMDTSALEVSGGSVAAAGLRSRGSSTLLLTGGVISADLTAMEWSSITMSGGSVVANHDITAQHSSSITFVGSDFELNGVPLDFGEVVFVQGTLTGMLASGDILDNLVTRSQEARSS